MCDSVAEIRARCQTLDQTQPRTWASEVVFVLFLIGGMPAPPPPPPASDPPADTHPGPPGPPDWLRAASDDRGFNQPKAPAATAATSAPPAATASAGPGRAPAAAGAAHSPARPRTSSAAPKGPARARSERRRSRAPGHLPPDASVASPPANVVHQSNSNSALRCPFGNQIKIQ